MKKYWCVLALATAIVGFGTCAGTGFGQSPPQARQGTVSIDGVELPYYIEGDGIPCLVINNALAMRRVLSPELRKTFRFIFRTCGRWSRTPRPTISRRSRWTRLGRHRTRPSCVGFEKSACSGIPSGGSSPSNTPESTRNNGHARHH